MSDGPEHDPRRYRLGVGAVIFNSEHLVWIGERRPRHQEHLETPWQMPQGGIDEGEEPRDAVIREVLEETGTDKVDIIGETPEWISYDLPDDLSRRAWKGRFRGQKQKWFALRFTGQDTDIDILADKKPEFVNWRWAPLDELPGLVVPFKRSMYVSLVETFSPLTRT